MTYKDVSVILSNLSAKLQSDFIREIFHDGKISDDLSNKIGQELCIKIVNLFRNNFLSEIIRLIDSDIEKEIFENLRDSEPELAEELRENIFTIEDVVLLSQSALQKVIGETTIKEFVISINGLPDELKERIWLQLPERLSERIKEEYDALPSPSNEEQKTCQSKLINIMTELRERGEITTEDME